ncbi:YceI family protein [Roseateles toxinivorans]|uniref:Polyisoprenoid-binding protein YceI n=1 Tax=Roseateles toxinivorans TaxID=270368 RepID=A0A4V3CTK9_9BURK|nr:YceI family protein [Roseateles toxinivorans]TDP72734.1 polyisoprenoid-binding protein YceI [Roseateles toxinivorans]
MKSQSLSTLASLIAAATVQAAPVSYKIDPQHTFPSFEADHMGISVWRGKMNKSSGSVVYDKDTAAGTVDITIDLASIDFGHDALNAWGRGEQFFNVKKFPRATYKGRFEGALPAQLVGELTLHGVTRPVTLTIHSLKCIPHPLHKRELCGADAAGSFRRDEFGLAAGKDYGFKMDVDLRIQVEAVAEK